MRALVVLNPSAHGGTGARRFEAVRPAIDAAFDATLVVGCADDRWRAEVATAVERGVRLFIAAGGDGTAHALLNALVELPHRPALESITLGAVGLGSSNDLLKPVRRCVGGIAVLLDAARAEPRDVIRCTHLDSTGAHQSFVLVSASLGVTASANARFSANGPLVSLLRRTSTTAAIVLATTDTVATWRNLPATVRVDHGEPARVALTSLSILKTEWLSGQLRFGHPVEPASGQFDVALAQGLGRCRLLADILALLRGRFDGRPGHIRWHARSADIWLNDEVPLELDGEIVTAHEIHFDVFPERIRLCA
jgi:diacylglycerol kinase (ATP)